MVSFKSLLVFSVALVATEAAIAPTYPQPGTIQVQGSSNLITWTFDGKDADQTYRIDFMTGSNQNQTVLKTIATDVSSSLLAYPFIAPAVQPYSAIYFFMFTGSKGDQAWTTRFGIVPRQGTALLPEPEKVQPDGTAIPWGHGQLDLNTGNETYSQVIGTAQGSISATFEAKVGAQVTPVNYQPTPSASGVATMSATLAQ